MRLKHENITVKYNIIFHNVLFIFNLQQKKWHSVFTCFSSESHFLITQEPRMTKIRDSNMHGIIKKNVARLQVTVNELGLLLVQILHGLGYFKGPNDSVFEEWKWHHSLSEPGPGPVQPLLQRGAEMFCDHPRASGRVNARAHELKHEPVALPRQRFELLGEVCDTVLVSAEKFFGYALHCHFKSTPFSSVNFCGAALPDFLFQLNLCMEKFRHNIT